MSAPWWHCSPLLVLTICSQWHFRRWVGDIWLMRNRWTSLDMHYTCSFLHSSLSHSDFAILCCSWALPSPSNGREYLCLPIKSNEMLWSEPSTIPANAVRKWLSCSTLNSLGSLHVLLVPTYHAPLPVQSLDPSCGKQRPLSHLPFLW